MRSTPSRDHFPARSAGHWKTRAHSRRPGGGATFNFIGNGLTLPGNTLNGTTFTNDGIITLSAGTNILDTATLNNNGTMTWIAATFYMNNSSVLNNQSGALFDLTGDHLMSVSAGTAGTFNNSGTFRKSAGTGTSTISNPFNNTDSVQVQSGTMLFTSSGTSTGSFDVSSGALLNFSAGSHTFNAGVTLPGVGPVRVGGATLTVNSGLSTSNFELTGGTVTGGDTITVTGSMNWSAGTMSGSGVTTIQSGATLTVPTGTSTLDTRTLDNSGTITWTGGTFYINSPAVLNNLSGALFDMQSNSTMSWSATGTGTFNNTGTFRKSAGAGTSTIVDIFNNTGGTIEGQSGTLSFTGGGTHTGGTYTVSSGATVTHSAVHSFSGSFSGTISGTLENTGTFTATGGGATFNFIGNGLSLPGNTLNGTTFTNDGIITLSAGTNILDTATLNNNGTMTWIAATFYMNNSAVLNNQSGALFDLTGNHTMSVSAGTAGTFNNSGTFRKSAGTGTSSIDDPFNNTGTVEVQTGTVVMSSGGTSTGAFDVSSGALLNFSTGSHTFNAGVTLPGAGPVRVGGATLTVNSGLSTSNFEVTGGTVTGGDTITVTGSMNWSAGTMSGSGVTTIQSGATLTVPTGTSTLDTRTLDNSGTITWTGGTFYINSPAVLNNLSGALFDMQSDNTMSWSATGTGTFNNTGTFRKSAGAGISTIVDIFNNTGGAIEGQSGTLSFTGGGTHTGGGPIRSPPARQSPTVGSTRSRDLFPARSAGHWKTQAPSRRPGVVRRSTSPGTDLLCRVTPSTARLSRTTGSSPYLRAATSSTRPR